MDKKIIDKIIELGKENGFLRKENEILIRENTVLNGKINNQKELSDFAEIIDRLFNTNKAEINQKAKILEQEEKKAKDEYSNKITLKSIIMEVVKNGLFRKK